MALSVTATQLGNPSQSRQSIARNVTMSTAGATSIEVLTVNHGLGVSPDKVIPVVRSAIATISAGAGISAPEVASWNASIALVHLPAAHGGATRANVDVLCEVVHSLVR